MWLLLFCDVSKSQPPLPPPPPPTERLLSRLQSWIRTSTPPPQHKQTNPVHFISVVLISFFLSASGFNCTRNKPAVVKRFRVDNCVYVSPHLDAHPRWFTWLTGARSHLGHTSPPPESVCECVCSVQCGLRVF